jgi:hypothetical protein
MTKKPCAVNTDSNNNNHNDETQVRYGFKSLNEMERQSFAEEVFDLKISKRMKLAELHQYIEDEYGRGFICRAHVYRLWKRWVNNPETAGADGRQTNKGLPRVLSLEQQRAWDIVFAHHCKYNTGLLMGLQFLEQVANFSKIDRDDFPTLAQCAYLLRTRVDKKTRIALNGDRLKAFDEAEAWTHRSQLEPDDEHQIDEGQTLLYAWSKEKSVTLYFSRQIDAASGVVRTSHYTTQPTRDRDTIWQMKVGCKRAPVIGLPYNCLPKAFKLDQASWHRTRSIRRINYLLRNRKGRKSRIQMNPPRQPRANSSVERNIGETKRKLMPKWVKQFEDYLAMKNRKKPLIEDALAYAEGIGHDFTEFDNCNNNGKKARHHKSRLDVYRDGAPKQSYEFSDKEIEETFIFYRQLKFTGHGVKLDGVEYDGSGVKRSYRHQMLWFGVPPEHSESNPSKTAIVAVEDKKTIFRPIGILKRNRDKDSKRISIEKQEQWVRDYDEGSEQVATNADLCGFMEQAVPEIEGGVVAREAWAEKARREKAKRLARLQKADVKKAAKKPKPKPKAKVRPKRPKRYTVEKCSTK